MTRVLHLSARADHGGGPRHILTLLRHFPAAVTSFVACPDDAPYAALFTAAVGAQNRLALPHRRFSLAALLKTARFIRRHDIALLHSHGKGAGLYSRLLVPLTGAACVHTFHGVHLGGYGFGRRVLYTWLERLLACRTRRLIAVSTDEAAQMRLLRLPPEKITVIANGVDIPPTIPARARREPLPVLSLSRFDYQKNSSLVVDIAERLAEKNSLRRFHFTLAGNGADKDHIQNLVTARGWAEHFSFTGFCDDPQALFRDSAVYLSTSRWEGLPLAVLEAMAWGLPVVATAVPGHLALLGDGEAGLLYPCSDAARAAELLESLLPEDRRAPMGERARAKAAANHSAARMTEETAALYASVLKGS